MWNPLKNIRDQIADLKKAREDLERSIKEIEKVRLDAEHYVWNFLQLSVGTRFQKSGKPLTMMTQEECVDVLLMLFHIAHVHDFSLYEAAKDKFVISQNRTWLPADENGVIRHAPEEVCLPDQDRQ